MNKFKTDKTIINKPQQGKSKLLTNHDETRILTMRAIQQGPRISVSVIHEKVLRLLGMSYRLQLVALFNNRLLVFDNRLITFFYIKRKLKTSVR